MVWSEPVLMLQMLVAVSRTAVVKGATCLQTIFKKERHI